MTEKGFDITTEKDQVEIDKIDNLVLLGRLSAGLAHELRNPLAGISATIQVLASKFDAESYLHEYTRTALNEVERINRIMDSLVAFSNPSATIPQPCSINGLLEEILHLIFERSRKRGVTMQTEFTVESDEVLLDSGKMKRALLDVLFNMLDAMPGGGELKIKTMICSENGRKVCVIEFSDTGPQLQQSDMTALFEPFNLKLTRGIGIGLAVAKNIILAHGGEITAENGKNQGMLFRVSIPADQEIE